MERYTQKPWFMKTAALQQMVARPQQTHGDITFKASEVQHSAIYGKWSSFRRNFKIWFDIDKALISFDGFLVLKAQSYRRQYAFHTFQFWFCHFHFTSVSLIFFFFLNLLFFSFFHNDYLQTGDKNVTETNFPALSIPFVNNFFSFSFCKILKMRGSFCCQSRIISYQSFPTGRRKCNFIQISKIH